MTFKEFFAALRPRRAIGGSVTPRRIGGDVPILLSRGVAVVPDSADVDLMRRLSPGTDVYTVSEWMTLEESEHP